MFLTCGLTSVFGATVTWTGEGGNGNWGTAGNWDTDKGLAQVKEGKDLLNPDGGNDNNMVFLKAGNYTVTFNESTGEINVKAN